MPARYPAIEPFEHGLLDASGRSAHGDAVMAATDRFTGPPGAETPGAPGAHGGHLLR